MYWFLDQFLHFWHNEEQLEWISDMEEFKKKKYFKFFKLIFKSFHFRDFNIKYLRL